MKKIADIPFSAATSSEGPIRDQLLALNSQDFLAIINRWLSAFLQSAHLPVAGLLATSSEIAAIQVPTVIVAGDDDVHTLTIAQTLHRLITGSQYHPPPVSDEVWTKARGTPVARQVQAEGAAPIFMDFLGRLTGVRS